MLIPNAYCLFLNSSSENIFPCKTGTLYGLREEHELKERISLNKSHVIDFEELSTRERMTEILELLQQSESIAFNDLIKKSEGKMGVAVVLLAIMELLKDSLIKGIQNEPFGKIHLSKKITGVH